MLWKDIIIFILVAYIVSRFLRFLVPILRVTSAASSQMRTMQEQMQAQMKEMERNQQQANKATFQKEPKQGRPKDEDYIDYEEV